jgi:hypothetical protein
MIDGKLFEVIDFRPNISRVAPVAVLRSIVNGIEASYYTGWDEAFSLEEDDDLDIQGDQITIHTADGAVVFVPLVSGADVLEFLQIYDLGLLHHFCVSSR